MRKILLALVIAVAPILGEAALVAQANLTCLSLQFQEGPDSWGAYWMDLSSSDEGYPNGELAPLYGAYSHWSYFWITDESGFDPMPGLINLDVPSGQDANTNGINDFYETVQAVSATTYGVYNIPGVVSRATVKAVWTRSARSGTGKCALTLNGFGTFTFKYSLIEFKGQVNYMPGITGVTCVLNLAMIVDPAQQIEGPISFVKSSTNRFDSMELQSGAWTNATGGLTFSRTTLDRDGMYYSGIVSFDDGNLGTSAADYFDWFLIISDSNDWNSNGVPDFTDNPRASLALSSSATSMELKISGEVGTVCEVQETTVLAASNWQSVKTVTLTNDPQTVSVDLPEGGSKFWRILVH